MLSDHCLSCPVLSVTLVYCGQTVGQIKMKLGTQVGLVPGHIVLYMRTQLPVPKKGAEPNFRPMSIVAKRSPISSTDENEQLFVFILCRSTFVLAGECVLLLC